MTRLFYSIFALLLMMISCQSSSPGNSSADANTASPSTGASTETTAQLASMTGDFPMKPDTIVIRGKFLPGCTMPKTIKIAEHNELNSPWKEVQVVNGEFNYHLYLAEPRRIAVKTENRTMYDFIATTKEKKFQLEIACANGQEKFDLKNSAENAAYRPFSNANKKFREDLDTLSKLDLSKPDVFAKLKSKFTDYQKTLAGIASANPGTFTATVFCAAEKLPDGSLASIDALRKNFLQREAIANPQIYNDFLAQRIILNYLSICDRKADQYNTLDGILRIALKNQDAAKRLEQIMYNIFYNRHEEAFVTTYIKWADNNPAGMINQSVKMQLTNLKRVIAGNPIIDIQLKDPSGAPKKLSDVVSSSKLTLLIFYSPTCSHCQEEIPQIVPIWQQYKSKGLKIYCAGFDATNDEWNWFIKNKATPEWTHVFEPSDGNPPSQQYVVNYTPTFIFISPQGKILYRFPTLDDVKTKIPELLK